VVWGAAWEGGWEEEQDVVAGRGDAPMKVTVTGGKGGTGKSTVATNIALLLAENYRTVLADADVECPNDYILLNASLQDEREVLLFKPRFVYSKCIKCGLCKRNCSESAIVMFPEGFPFLLPNLCSGCRTCQIVCPVDGAIEDDFRLVGHTYRTEIEKNLVLITGMLKEGEERSYPTVVEVRRRAQKEEADVYLFDTMPGTGNHVAVAVEDSKVVIAVTEPTPLGIHDLEMILKLLKKLEIKGWVVVNRSDMASVNHRPVVERYGAEIIAEIPQSEEVLKSYVKGTPLVRKYPNSEIAGIFRDIVKRIEEVM